jgi:hypothetical protein
VSKQQRPGESKSMLTRIAILGAVAMGLACGKNCRAVKSNLDRR